MTKEEFRHFVRIANTDLEGKKPILISLRKIKGVSISFANAICNIANIDKSARTGYLPESDVKKAEEILRNPAKFNIPSWMFNRRKDFETGEDKHLLTTDLSFAKELDIKRMQKSKSYKGVRHAVGLPVRGQRTKAHFRKGRSLGVAKRKGKSGRV